MSLSLNRNDWFVDPDGSTDNNLVSELIDGAALFGEINAQLGSLTQDDFCYFAAWAMTANFRLTTGATSTISDQFVTASNAGADIRILLFQGISAMAAGGHYALKDDLAQRSGGKIQVHLDRKHQKFASHHQKFCIFGKKDASTGLYALTALCGGIDPADQRFDDSNHRPQISIAYHLGWHDVHTKVEGPAAEALLGTFIDRWNDHDLPMAAGKYNTDLDAIAEKNIQLPSLQTNTHQVEVLHTYSCLPTETVNGVPGFKSDFGYSFATNAGIQTMRQAYLKAIGMARHYIYIENQYFADTPILEALLNKLENSDVKIIVVTPYFMDTGYDELRLDAWKNMFKPATNAANFFLCDLRHPEAGYGTGVYGYPDSGYREPIYVHVKLMIVDDVYALIGSANLNLRSMEADSELAIAVLDSQTEVDHNLQLPVCKFARDLRIALFKEHLMIQTWGTSPAERSIDYGISNFITKINDPANGVNVLPPTRVFKHDPENVYYTPGRRLGKRWAEGRPKCQF